MMLQGISVIVENGFQMKDINPSKIAIN